MTLLQPRLEVYTMNVLLSETDLRRKALVVNRLLQCVGEYHETFNKPVPMRILSAKFSKALQDLGGFQEIVLELAAFGSIEVVLHETGRKEVYPEGQCLKLKERSKLI